MRTSLIVARSMSCFESAMNAKSSILQRLHHLYCNAAFDLQRKWQIGQNRLRRFARMRYRGACSTCVVGAFGTIIPGVRIASEARVRPGVHRASRSPLLLKGVSSRETEAVSFRSFTMLLRLTLLLLVTLPALCQDNGVAYRNLRGFRAVGDGHTNDTAALQRAIDQVSGEHGTLVVPAGTFVIGTVQLRSHMTLLLEHGAVLQGSPRVEDYGTIAQYGLDHRYGTNSSGEGDRVGMLIARDAEDIRITGDGTIDGDGAVFFDASVAHVGADFDARSSRNPAAFLADVHRTEDGPLEVRASGRPGTMLQFHRVRNVTLEGVTLRNAPNWTLHLQHAQHVLVHGLRIENDVRLPNNDAMDCMDCHDVRVSDSNFTAGDDDFAIVGSSDVAITNCTLRSNSAAIRYEDSSDAVFSNLVIHSNRGIAIFAREGTYTRNALFQNIVMDTRLKHGHWW
ncbi:MAG: right-handed parallel beta-helix repeat-containing protein, partial [Terriglobus roseus]|nr:right-handed parallel beta-helix repeat-containing protein [Terriglobus roseus]